MRGAYTGGHMARERGAAENQSPRWGSWFSNERGVSLPWTWGGATPLGKSAVANGYKMGLRYSRCFLYNLIVQRNGRELTCVDGKSEKDEKDGKFGDWTSTCLRSPRGVERRREARMNGVKRYGLFWIIPAAIVSFLYNYTTPSFTWRIND